MLNNRKFKVSHRGVRILGKGCRQSVMPFSDISDYDTDEELDEKTDDEIRCEIRQLSNGLNRLNTVIDIYLRKENPTREQNLRAFEDIKLALNKYTKLKPRYEKINDIEYANLCNSMIDNLRENIEIVRELIE
jgi:hypothetical protein